MRLATFADDAGARIGVMDGEGIRDVTAADPSLPRDMLGLIIAGRALLPRVLAAAAAAPYLPPGTFRLLAPIPRPARNIFCIGKNYREHAKEFASSGFDATAKEVVPEAPVVFSKPPSTVIGHGDDIPAYLDPTASVDYEGELAVVIGAGGRGIGADHALRHVFGYTIVNDVTARTLQHRHRQWLLGKGIDGFCPMGPAILTADDAPDPKTLRLSTWVNGELRQDVLVADLIFDIPALIATISAGIALEPGDIIATGTPVGVGIGFTPPRYLVAGDRVRITVTGIGTLENPVA
jgi:2-keto-4-pentenoate hydratase/2-oxohepta-3-ene-1,7-dioic acid hydratase in catechol pathway